MSIYLKVTNRCDIRCPHCFISHYYGDMHLSVVDAVAEHYPGERIIFHGGEPTLRGVEYLREAVRRLQARECLIQSNLTGDFDGRFISLLKEHFGSRIGTSFDMGRFDYTSRILRNVHLLSSQGIRVTAVITVTNDLTFPFLKFFIDAFRKRGGVGFTLQPVTPVKSPAVDPDHYMTIFRKLYLYPQNMTSRKIETAMSGCGVMAINGGNCARDGVRTIDPDGTVYVCPDFAGQQIFPLGNIDDPDFDDSVRNENNRIFYEREMNLSLSCCEFWNLCQGGCASAAYFGVLNGNTGRDPFCSSYREILRHV